MPRNHRYSLFGLLASVALAHAAAASTFEDALVATYTNNPQIKAERQRLEATDESVAQAASGFRPTVTANYSNGGQQTNFNGQGDVKSHIEEKSIRAEQPLFRGGGTWSAYQSAKQRVKSGQYSLHALEQQVLLDAISAYMDVIANSALLELARNNADVLGQQQKAAQTRFQVGEVTRTDVAQAEARLSNAKTAVISNEGLLLNSLAVFERVVGYRPEGTLAVPEKLPELPATLNEAIGRGKEANPQFLAAIHAAKSARLDVRTNQATLLPRVSLVGTMSRLDGAGPTGASAFDQDRVGVEMAIPLYQSGAEYSRVRQASALARQRDYESSQTRLGVEQSITQAWQQLETAIVTIATRQEQINASQLALEGVKQEQQYGSRTVLDVLDAEQELFTARTNLVAAQRDRIVAAYSLSFTLGQLTPQTLALNVTPYDASQHADDVAWKAIGF